MRSGRSRSLFDAAKDQHREAASTAPLNTRMPGSPEWCYQTMGLLKSSYRMIHIDQEDFTHHLNELREHRAWEKVPVDHPYGTENKMLVAELGKRVEEIRAELNAAKQARLAAQNRELNATTPDLKAPHRPEKDSAKNNDTTVIERGSDYAIAKLRKEGKDDERIEAIYQRVLAGELTANAGMVEADFRKQRASRKTSALDKILKLLPNLTEEERHYLRERLDRQHSEAA